MEHAAVPENLRVRRKGLRMRRWLLGLTLVLMPFFLAGARPWIWPLIVAFFLFGVVILVWSNGLGNLTAEKSNKWLPVFGLLLLYPLLQVLPMPENWLSILSPHRLFWLKKAQEVTRQPVWLTSVSYTPLETLFGWIFWLFLAVFALVLKRMLLEERSLAWLFNLLFIFAAFEAFYGLLQVLVPSMGVLWESQGHGLARGTFGNRNHYACFLGMLWPLLLTYVWGLGSEQAGSPDRQGAPKQGAIRGLTYSERERLGQIRQKQVFYAFVIGLMVLGIFFSRSRAGIAGSLVSLSVLVIFSRAMRTKGMLLMVIGCWAVMLSYGSVIGFHEIIARFDELDVAASNRSRIWGTALQIIREHTWTGTGLGSFGELFRVYQDFLADTMTTDYAHSDYLQLTVELGVPVAVSMFLLVWAWWWRMALRVRKPASREFIVEQREVRSGRRKTTLGSNAQGWSRNGSEQKRLIAVGALAGSAAFLFHCWVEFNWQIPANSLYFVMLMVFSSTFHKY